MGLSEAGNASLATDRAGTVAEAGVDALLEARALQDALGWAIASRRGEGLWTVDHASWVVTLHSPEERDFYGRTLEEALAWCLVWLMVKGTPADWGHEIGVGPLRV